MATNDGTKYVFFYGDSASEYPPGSKNYMLSQWFDCKFSDPEQPGITFTSAEQFMMAGKARLFGDSATLALIMATQDPGSMKALGRQVAGFQPAVWDAAAVGLVVRGNFLKFGADPELREMLLGTGDALLVETAPDDRIWGIGLDEEAARATPESEWPGRNLLGKALVEARELLRRQEQEGAQEKEQGQEAEQEAEHTSTQDQAAGKRKTATMDPQDQAEDAEQPQQGKEEAAEQEEQDSAPEANPREKRQRVECQEVLDTVDDAHDA
ncbi:hypothetical protein HXX76_010207 [Chlamydomonas incerta]|uniref:NADAR domain-containing protein n=1 Tax=Chlamydomonas incerta TaxID=51695 RepID=A0A835VY25_CHLIN|nr:hypothetical protein HXX76_010207 [Chlamydomonas incerta]|eukprot:KAG2430108.1 hypothetical protein HXX76_010207 [Chlamydomonas incerta]